MAVLSTWSPVRRRTPRAGHEAGAAGALWRVPLAVDVDRVCRAAKAPVRFDSEWTAIERKENGRKSEGRGGGEEGESTCRYRGSRLHSKKKYIQRKIVQNNTLKNNN